jgi:type IV secretory pathway VirB10-like protein
MTVPHNGNPGPRPALRKAADADLHPVATPAGGPVHDGATPRGHIAAVPSPPDSSKDVDEGPADRSSATATTEPPAPPKKGDKKGKRKAAKKQHQEAETPKRMFQGATSDVMRHPEPRDRDVLMGKQADLTVRIPKRLRTAARAQAERRGTTVDDVVTGLLAGWVDGS